MPISRHTGAAPWQPASTTASSHGLLAPLFFERLLIASDIPEAHPIRPIDQQKGGQTPQDQGTIEPTKRAVPVLPAETREDYGAGRA